MLNHTGDRLLHSIKLKLKSDFTRLSKIQGSPYYRGIALWDSLPHEIQNDTSKIKFKEKVKKHN